MYILSDKERIVLRELLLNSDKARKKMADDLNMTAPDLSRTISNMIKEGVIKRFTVDIDYERIGYDEAAIFVCSVVDKKNNSSVVGRMMAQDDIIEVYDVFGEDRDIVIKLLCTNSDKIREITKNIAEMEEVKSGPNTFTIKLAHTYKNDRGPKI